MSGRDAAATRSAILDAAERLTLGRGFAGAGLDRILADSGSSKGAFFHHFASKQALGQALIRRWAEGDRTHLEATLTRAEELVDDPLQQLLVFLGLFAEEADQHAGELPGCLFAAYTYQADLFDAASLEVVADSMLLWRRRLRAKLAEIADRRPSTTAPLDLDALADSVNVVFEGAFVVARAVRDPGLLARHLRLHRTLLHALLAGPESEAPPGAHAGPVAGGAVVRSVGADGLD